MGSRPNQREGPLRLHLGCGEIYLDGYVNVDAYPSPKAPRPPDRILRVEDVDYEPGSVDEIYTAHVVEHLSRDEVLRALPRWHRVLRPGGLLTIEVPDAEAIMRRLLAQRREEDKDLYYYLLLGTQETPGEFHKGGYTFPRLRRLLTAAGFVEFVDGRREPNRIENRMALHMYKPRQWRAVLLECRKPQAGTQPDTAQLRRLLFFAYDMQDLPVARLRGRLARALPFGTRVAELWRALVRR